MKKKCEWCGRVLELDTFGMLCPHCKPFTSMRAADDKLEKLQEKCNKLTRERDEARDQVAQLKETVAAYEQATVKQSLTVCPEPSRLEIAAMLKAGWFANRDADFNATDHKWWIEQADALIAAAKEAK